MILLIIPVFSWVIVLIVPVYSWVIREVPVSS